MSHEFTPEQAEERKRALYEAMAPRRRKFVDRIGYENWNPFQEPLDPLDIRRDVTGHTAQELTEKYLRDRGGVPSPEYRQAANTFNVELVANPARVKPLLDYCLWYAALLERHGKSL